MENNNLISEYRNASFTHRLYMYMDLPELRLKFMAIEQNDSDLKRRRETFKLRKFLTKFLNLNQYKTEKL